MKSWMLMIVMLLMQTAYAGKRKLVFLKALEQKLIQAKALSKGGFKGYCMTVQVKNTGPDSLEIIFEPGQLLNSCSDAYQDILIVKEEHLLLKKFESKSIALKGYCCQASNCSPAKNSTYDFSKKADSSLIKLAKYLSLRRFEEGIEQQAVWAVSNNKPTATIAGNPIAETKALREFVSSLKSEKIPWYNLTCYNRTDSRGYIHSTPVQLEGQLHYSLTSPEYLTFTILDAKDRVVCYLISGWGLVGKNQVFDVNIPVVSLDSGTYRVELRGKDKVLVRETVTL